ncbi:MAG: M15 family metallopeptidase [Bacteroidota bacterium]
MNEKRQQILIIAGSIITGASLLILFRKQIATFLNFPLKAYFEAKTEEALLELHPKFRNVAKRFLKEVEDKLGYTPIITDAGRTYNEAQANQQSGTGVAMSYHLAPIGLAFDVNFKNEQGIPVLVKASSKTAWQPVVDIAKKYNLEWGGNFTNVAYDPVHFQYSYVVQGRKPSELLKLDRDSNGFIKI